MARQYAPLHTDIWQDETFVGMSAHAQRLYLLAISQPNITWVGTVPFTAKRWAKFAQGTTPKVIADAAAELVRAGLVLLDEDIEEMWVRSFVKYNATTQPKLRKAAQHEYKKILSGTIRQAAIEAYPWLAQTNDQRQDLDDGQHGDQPDDHDDGQDEAQGDDPGVKNQEQKTETGDRGQPPRRCTWHDLLRPDAGPPLLFELDDDVERLCDVHGPERVDIAIRALMDRRLRFPFPSHVRKALEAELGEPPAEPSAQTARIERSERRRAGLYDCEDCHDLGVVEGDDGFVDCECKYRVRASS